MSLAPRLDLELAAVRHRVDRIRDQVREQVPHQPRIGAHQRSAVQHLALHVDLRPRLGAERQVQRFVDERLHLDGFGGRFESARLIEEPADHLRHALHFGVDDLHLRAGRLG